MQLTETHVLRNAAHAMRLLPPDMTLADSNEVNLTLYGHLFVRPLPAFSSVSSGRRRLQQQTGMNQRTTPVHKGRAHVIGWDCIHVII